MLDQIRCGLVLLDAQARVRYLNLAALQLMDEQFPLMLAAQTLQVRNPQDRGPLAAALTAASQGHRRLLTVGRAGLAADVSVVPFHREGTNGAQSQGGILLVLGAPRTALAAAVLDLANGVGLTPAEARVLDLLCAGARPAEIASRLGVAVSTVRTQIGSIRHKTGTTSIRALVRQVAVMPPLD